MTPARVASTAIATTLLVGLVHCHAEQMPMVREAVHDAPKPVVAAAATASASTVAPAPPPKVTAVEVTQTPCALLETHRVFCWGPLGADNAASQYVDGLPPVDTMHVGDGFGCARAIADQRVYCWGLDYTAQRGTGTADAPETTTVHPAGQVVLADGTRVVAKDFLAGGAHACALLATGDVVCWGATMFGQAGERPGHDATGYWRAVKKPVVVFHGATRVFGGVATSCAVNAKEELYCWGDQDAGVNGAGSTFVPKKIAVPGPVRAMAFGSGHSCLLTDAPGVFCRGSNDHGDLGSAGRSLHTNFDHVPELSRKYVSIAAARSETCAVTTDGDVECLGALLWGNAKAATTTANVPELGKAIAVAAELGLAVRARRRRRRAVHGQTRIERGRAR